MKKWIPKDTSYCYGDKKIGRCKWLIISKSKPAQENGYCKYLKLGDWYEDGTSLLWDECKECGIGEDYTLYKNKR